MKPQAIKEGLTFLPIPDFNDVDVSFGSFKSAFFNKRNLPEIPPVFEKIAQELFFNGGDLPDLPETIDKVKARRAISAWLGSFEPGHEEKIATVGYALWVWSSSSDDSDEVRMS